MFSNRVGSVGKVLAEPTVSSGGAVSLICVVPVAEEPAQLVIHTVSVSPQAEGEASQQLWPPETFCTIVDSLGCARFTTVCAAW